MRWLAGALLVAACLLQVRLWATDDGVAELRRLVRAVESQAGENTALAERNARLAAEVSDLKQGMMALEERARSELGMIARNETFYLVVAAAGTADASPEPSGTRTAAR